MKEHATITEELITERAQLIRACRAVLTFYRVGGWHESVAEWERLTGTGEATTKGLCDFIRATLVNAGERVECPTCGVLAPPDADDLADAGDMRCSGCARGVA